MVKLFVIASMLASATSAILLWNPTGPYHVGYTQHIFNHTTPNDFTKPGNFLLATIYYPTLHIPNLTSSYLDPISSGFFETTIGMPNGSLSRLNTRLQLAQAQNLSTSHRLIKPSSSRLVLDYLRSHILHTSPNLLLTDMLSSRSIIQARLLTYPFLTLIHPAVYMAIPTLSNFHRPMRLYSK